MFRDAVMNHETAIEIDVQTTSGFYEQIKDKDDGRVLKPNRIWFTTYGEIIPSATFGFIPRIGRGWGDYSMDAQFQLAARLDETWEDSDG